MSYGKGHTPDQCDKCGENVGQKNLFPIPSWYMDKNDESHPDKGNGYRQYYVCKTCYDEC